MLRNINQQNIYTIYILHNMYKIYNVYCLYEFWHIIFKYSSVVLAGEYNLTRGKLRRVLLIKGIKGSGSI